MLQINSLQPGIGSCPPNGYIVSGICVICPVNSQLINSQCVCNPGFVNETTNNPRGICIQSCVGGILNNQGLCVSCPANSQWDAQTQSCTCQIGFSLVSGFCTRTCGIAAQLDQNGQCSCIAGYFPLNDAAGNCAICSQGCRICSSQTMCNLC